MNLKKIQDIAQEEQTDDLKLHLYDLVKQFVYSEWRHYHPHLNRNKDTIDDVINKIYVDFLTPKSRVKGNEQSLLDKWDPERLDLPSLVKVSVRRKLIDLERSYKGEINYSESYDEETGDLSLDFLAKQIAEDDENLETMEFTKEDVDNIKSRYDQFDEEKRNEFLTLYEKIKNSLPDNFKKLFAEVVGNDKPTLSRKNEPEVAQLLHKDLDYEFVVNEHKVKDGEALRITFIDSSEESEASKDIDIFTSILEDNGWKFYSKRGNNWYYIKA